MIVKLKTLQEMQQDDCIKVSQTKSGLPLIHHHPDCKSFLSWSNAKRNLVGKYIDVICIRDVCPECSKRRKYYLSEHAGWIYENMVMTYFLTEDDLKI